MYHSFIEIDQGNVSYIYLSSYMQQCMYETRIHNIHDLQKDLKQTWFDFDQDIINAVIDQWHDHPRCMLVVDT